MLIEGQFWLYFMLSSLPGPRLKKQPLCDVCRERGRKMVALKTSARKDPSLHYIPLPKAKHMISTMSMAMDELSILKK